MALSPVTTVPVGTIETENGIDYRNFDDAGRRIWARVDSMLQKPILPGDNGTSDPPLVYLDQNVLAYATERTAEGFTVTSSVVLTNPERLFNIDNTTVDIAAAGANVAIEILTPTITSDAPTQYWPFVLLSETGLNYTLQMELRDGTSTYSTAFNGAVTKNLQLIQYSLPANDLTGARFTFSGMPGSLPVRAIGVIGRNNDPYQWTVSRDGDSMYGVLDMVNTDLNIDLEHGITLDGNYVVQFSANHVTKIGQTAGDLSTATGQTVTGSFSGNQGTGNNQSAYGRSSGTLNTGDFQSAFGSFSGRQNSGSRQSAHGYQAGDQNSGTSQSTFGYASGLRNSGSFQSVVGRSSGADNIGHFQSTFGAFSGNDNSGHSQSVFGYFSGDGNSGAEQTAGGRDSGRNNSGAEQSAFGAYSGRSNTASFQSSHGAYSGDQNTGEGQASLGYSSGELNSGAGQTAIGKFSGRFNGGANNTSLGYESFNTFSTNAGGAQTFAATDLNIANGNVTITAHGFGANNTYINLMFTQGTGPITTIVDGSVCNALIVDANTIQLRGKVLTAAGVGTGHTLTPQLSFTNSTAIGAFSEPDASNQVMLGDTAVTEVKSSGVGNFLAGIQLPPMDTTTMQAIVAPSPGRTIYNTTVGAPAFWDGANWRQITNSIIP